MTFKTLSPLLLPALALLAGCASAGDRYPSLAIRDAERVKGTFEPGAPVETPAPTPPASADLLTRLDQLRADASAAHADFAAAVPGTRSSVAAARGDGVESDRWAAAQVALADLDALRSRTAIALGDLDLLYADATLAYEQREPIGAARSEISAMVADEDATLAELRGSI